MHIEKRGKSSYRVTAWINGTHRDRFTVRAETRHQATKEARQEIVRREAQALRIEAGQYTIGEALERWQEEGMPPSVIPKARIAYHAVGSALIEDAPAAVADAVSDWLSDGLKNTTINRRLAAIKKALRLSYDTWRWIDIPVHDRIKSLSEKGTARENFLSPTQVVDLLRPMRTEERNFLLVMAYTGLRPWNELMPLLPNDFDGQQIHVRQSKTKTRIVPVTPEIAEILTDSLPWNTSYSRVRDQFDIARNEFNRPDLWIYDLRHTFASWLMSNPDVPVTVVRDLLGHSNLAMTSRYSHLRTDALADAVAKLPKIGG